MRFTLGRGTPCSRSQPTLPMPSRPKRGSAVRSVNVTDPAGRGVPAAAAPAVNGKTHEIADARMSEVLPCIGRIEKGVPDHWRHNQSSVAALDCDLRAVRSILGMNIGERDVAAEG